MQTSPAFIDSHCHLDFSCFDTDRQEILKSCTKLGIGTIVLPGTQAAHWQNQIDLVESFSQQNFSQQKLPQLKFALGLHPYFLSGYQDKHLIRLKSLLQQHQDKVVALGEIGLDAAIELDWQTQLNIFIKQLNLAKELSLPIILHHRKTHNELIQTIKNHDFKCGGIVHAFSGSFQQALTYIELGFKLGVGGGITYHRAHKTRQTISQLPISSLVLETDAPDMPLSGKQGSRNTPQNLVEIFNCLVKLRTESPEEIKQAIYKNTVTSLKNMD
ncbi:TatD family hydrolase [Paraglaciecola aquimarina]|uniref:TatD family hydrolase n=1 Tax=Paraglaciecola algarum TaxID=3050085 RepID=A0ABS9D402_9ALTE|nr:TatD family hydrolase [Paraglaciecola sp. G1-23]MCF2946554.1 TatD family hydrolase [Paraglaciecola sp. G1-23]